MKKFILFCLFAFTVLQSQIFAQCMLYEVPLAQRIGEAELIVEGKVISQQSYWNESHSMIYTANLVEVHSVLKGDLEIKYAEIRTEGGTVGNEAVRVEPGVKLLKGSAGMFFLKSQSAAGNSFPSVVLKGFELYAGVQGFIQYDEFLKASDPFKNYRSTGEIYTAIEKQTGKNIENDPEALQSFFKTKTFLKEKKQDKILVATITSFTPTTITAGTFSTLTINGTGFGSTAGTVEFKNANNGGADYVPAPGNHIVSWSNTQIQVRVPEEAGTGTIRVTNSLNEQGISSAALIVQYAHINVEATNGQRYTVDLVDSNRLGGYTFYLNSSFAANSAATDAYKRAMQTWRCGTLVNFRISSTTTSVSCDIADNINVVSFDNTNCSLPTGTLGVTYSYWVGCGSPINWYLKECDQIFKAVAPGNGWNFSTGTTPQGQYDFQSVATHELGHAHQLGHIIAPGKVMHYAIASGSNVRVLDNTSDVAGGEAVVARSSVSNSCGPSRMIPLTSSNCSISAPIANFSGTPVSGCSPLTVQFTDGSGGATSWSWTFGNGATSTQQNPTVTYQNPGTYSVTLVVTNTSGSNMLTKTNYITVFGHPQPNAGDDRSICIGKSTQLGGTPTGGQGPFTYSWSPALGLNSTTSATPTATPIVTTQYNVTVTDANGCTGTDAVTVTVLPLPVTSITANRTSFCEGETATLDAGAGFTSYVWSTGAQTRSITVSQEGVYSVTVTNSNGCEGISQPFTITVNPKPTPSIAGPEAVCPNTTATYTVATLQESNVTFTVTGGTLVSSAGNSATVRWGASGGGSVRAVETSAQNCTGEVTTNVIVQNSLKPGVSASGALSLCEGESVTLDAGSGYTSYKWSNGSIAQIITVTESGNYTVTVTDAGGCSGTSDPTNVTVNPNPLKPSITQVASLLTAVSPNPVVQYQWYRNDEKIPGANSQTYNAQLLGLYFVEITDQNGCTAKSEPVSVLTSGIEDFTEKYLLKIYPNPTSGIFSIAGTFKNGAEISVTNLSGEEIFTFKSAPSEMRLLKTMNISELPVGVYLLKIRSVSDEAMVKIIKE
ncbi:MAG: PKD domain-containing protein [Bacteroidota bacterium]